MNVTDPIGDMLSRIRNAQERGKPKVTTPASRLRARVLDVLQQEGRASCQQQRPFASDVPGCASRSVDPWITGRGGRENRQARLQLLPPTESERSGLSHEWAR